MSDNKTVIHTERNLKYFFYSILALIILTVLAGLMTFFFVETEGVVSKATKSKVQGAAYTAQRGSVGSYDGGKKTILNVNYDYSVDQKTFNGSFIAFWLIDSPKETYWANQKVKVFYAGFYPKIAVLKKGPDVFLLLILIVITIIYFFIKSTFIIKEEDV